jgi:large subunit ribosomal protein L25
MSINKLTFAYFFFRKEVDNNIIFINWKNNIMEVVKINGTVRTEVGKKASKAVRNSGAVPCVIYGGSEVVHFSAVVNEFRALIYTPDFKIAEVTVGGKTYKCILKDKQFHPVSDALVHVDLLNLVEGQSVKVEVPIRFKGVSPGVKVGGKLLQNVRRVKIKCLPAQLINEVRVDISSLELGQSLRVRDIQVGEGIEIMQTGGIPIATVEIPRALRSAQGKQG